MNNNDEYLVYIQPDGSRHYYKNRKLHRETGPATVNAQDVNKFINLPDENLYTATDKPVEFDLAIGETKKSKSKVTIITPLKKRNFSLPTMYSLEDPIEYNYGTHSSTYWLEGKKFSKEEFTSIMLKKEMEAELPQAETQPKKLKI